MVCIGLFFIYTTFAIFATYRTILNKNESEYVYIASNICWVVLYGHAVFLIMHLGHSVTREVTIYLTDARIIQIKFHYRVVFC